MSKVITEWRAKEVLAEISGRVASGMDKAASFAAEQARGKAPRQTGKLATSIAYEVKARGSEITGYVGTGSKVFYGRFVEMGTRKLAARPFLRPAVFENADQILRLIREG